MQAKLLRFLEHRRFMRVGGSTKIAVDARLVCATLRPLEQDVDAGRFRPDLFYRIQGITLEVPPLRERAADLVPLLRQFVAQLSARHGTAPPRFTRAAIRALAAHAWPGNVRELRNVVENACLLREGRPVRTMDLPAPIQAATRRAGARAAEPGARRLEIHLERPLDDSVARIVTAVLDLE
jgi:DNA-binding NtrC family response regulator